MKNCRVLLIIPAYNEEKNIIKVFESVKSYPIDIIVINDGSSDNTAGVCAKYNIPCINSILNLGIGGAVQTGYKYADLMQYDIAIQFDGDGQHNIADVNKLINAINSEGFDFCIGSRFLENSEDGFKSTFSRRMGIRLISFLIHKCTRQRISDPTSGYRAANKRIISIFANSYPTEYPEPESITFLLKQGFKIKEVPVRMNERTEGTSSIHSWKNIYYMINVCLSIFLINFSRKGEGQ